ncbi:MAG: sigma-70 family RNA polymerase sigma factor, partial [Planctomycetota bacterium]
MTGGVGACPVRCRIPSQDKAQGGSRRRHSTRPALRVAGPREQRVLSRSDCATRVVRVTRWKSGARLGGPTDRPAAGHCRPELVGDRPSGLRGRFVSQTSLPDPPGVDGVDRRVSEGRGCCSRGVPARLSAGGSCPDPVFFGSSRRVRRLAGCSSRMDERAATVGSEELLAHAGWVRALARRLARDHESAEDLVQETWLTALRKPPRRGPDLRGWLARVVTNSARRQGRADRRRLERETRAHRDAQEPSGAELILEVEEQQTIGRVVLQLAEPYRSVILRHYWRGETPAQIARRTGTSSATVRSQLARGRAELRKALACHYGSDARSMYAGLLTAAGPSRLSWITPWVQGALIVKQSEKLGWIAAAGLGLALVGAGWNALSTGDGAGSVTEAAAAPGLEPLEPEPQVDDTLAATASSSTDARREVTIPSERAALEPTPAPTRVVARFVDSSGGPIAGATLRLEQGHHAATSEADGRVELTVPGSAIQHWNERQRPTSFVAEREGCATRFLLATPSAGMDTDLGELVLEPGGSLAGVVVDGANNLLDDVRVVATGVELKASIETLRSQGPETWAESNFPSSVSERGQFVVRGVPVGHARLWARVEGTGWVISEPIVVRPRSETGGLRIVLRALSPADLIRGVVHDPDGNPVSRAQVTYQFPSTSYGVRYTSTGEDGRFEIIAEVRKAHDLSVEDHENRLRPTIVRGVEPGSDEITIVLPAARWLRVAVIDAETDEPLTEPWIYTHGEDTLEYDSRAAHESDDLGVGGHLVRIPQNSFTLHVRQDGYERWELGPLDPATAPENLEARLAPLAGVSGRVTFLGNPVEGATVQLLRATQAKTSTISYGFRMRLDPFGGASALTGPDGRFSIGATEAGAFLLIVTKAGLAVGERGPLAVDPRHDMTDVDIALVHGGAIEGVVLVPPGRDPAGNLVS